MKKIFTSISVALCLVASSFTTSAQTVQLSEAQKTQIQKEVLPVVFEQIKQETGLDILGLAKPSLTSDFIGSLPIFNAQSGLRADQPTPYKMQVDSVIINLEAIPGIPPAILAILGKTLKVECSDFKTTTIPMVDMFLGRGLKIELPGTIKAGSLAEIKIATTGKDGNLAPFTLDMTMTMPLLGAQSMPLLKYSMTQNSTTSLLEASLDIQEGMRAIMGLLSPAEPGQPETPAMDFLVTMDIAGFLTGGAIPMSLYGVPEAVPTQKIPMGDAAVALDFSNQQMPIKTIGLTSYENAQAKGWRDLMFKMEQKAQDLVLTIDNMVYSSADKKDSKLANSTIVTMTDNTKDMTLKDTKSAMRSVINRVVTELATEGKVAPYRMLVETKQDLDGDGVITANEKMTVMDVEVTPSIGADAAVADVNIKSYAYDEETGAPTITNMTVKATAATKSEVITVDVIPEGSPAPIASSYFKSNVLGVATSNDNIAVSDLKVTPVEGGLYIANNGKATYRIINMTGATLVNGTVSGDNAYISTSSLAKGIYVIVVTENGVSQSVKFVR